MTRWDNNTVLELHHTFFLTLGLVVKTFIWEQKLQDLSQQTSACYLAYHILMVKLVPVNCLSLMAKHAMMVETILQIDTVSLKRLKKKKKKRNSDNVL